jgi:hypothetical protein
MSRETDEVLLKYFEKLLREAFHAALVKVRPDVQLTLWGAQSSPWKGGDGNLLIDIHAGDLYFNHNFHTSFEKNGEFSYKLTLWNHVGAFLVCDVSYVGTDSYDLLFNQVANAVEVYFNKSRKNKC